ncbi:tetratricopeptide repeat protein [Chitinibacter sp. GC72]|uniref:tetratricopeptide repeat protein n=1 Tax=Chitinibacter sp. GC72 TaxID=1526917 RepID=UPI0012FC1C62|nr:hypothetical protein [Chitinibacter sp. GC72]
MLTITDHQIIQLGDIWHTAAFEKLRQAERTRFLTEYYGDDEYDDEDDVYECKLEMARRCIFFDGDASLSRDEWEVLCKANDESLWLVVIGNLDFHGGPLPNGYYSGQTWVTGDVQCDGVAISPTEQPTIGGNLTARHYAAFFGRDDEAIHRGFQGRVDTPHAFFWYHDWRNITLNDDTVLHIQCGCSDFVEPDSPRWFFGHDDLLALHPTLFWAPSAWGNTQQTWYFSALSSRMAAKESVYIEGFDPACLPLLTQARSHLKHQQCKEAFLHCKAAIALAADYQPAWLGAADALYKANALEQAIPYAQRAVALLPTQLRHVNNEASVILGLSLLRLGQWDAAIAVATTSIEDCQKHEKGNLETCRVLFRVRGEAFLRRGDLEPARLDLLQASEMSYFGTLCHWLAGLAHYQLGSHDAAETLRQRSGEFAERSYEYEEYEELRGSDFYYARPTRVDWESQTLAEQPEEVRDTDYWLRYLQAQAFDSEKCFRAIPAEFLTPEFCLAAIRHCPKASHGDTDIWVAKHFPADAFDATVATRLIECSARNLSYIPPRLISKTLLLQATQGAFDLALVSSELLDSELCYKLVERGVPPNSLPAEWLDHALCLHAVRHEVRAIETVPGKFKDETFYLTALAWADSQWWISNRIPQRYLKPDMICRALAINFGLIQHLPGKLVDETVFEHAQTQCPDPALWAQLITRHGRDFRKLGHGQDCAEDCWAVFWDEELILAEINNDGDHLSPFEIPADKYTQQIADAAFARDPIHLGSIPRTFITQKMAEHFARAHPDRLHDVPLPLRSERVCQLAAEHSRDKGGYFRHVPLALRDQNSCITALLHNAENAAFIPLAQEYAVYDTLLGASAKNNSRRNNMSVGRMLCRRGLGAFTLGLVDQALADFDTVIARGQNTTDKPGLLSSVFGSKKPRGQAEDFNDEDVNDARLYKAWVYKQQGQLDAMRGVMATMDQPYHELLEHFSRSEVHDAVEFSLQHYEAYLGAAGQAIQDGNYAEALEFTLQARALLEVAQHPDPHLWAFVLDHLRFITYELALFDENQRLCREILDRLANVLPWPYLEADNILRAARRAASNTLAWTLADSDDPAEIELAVNYANAALEHAPIEDKSVTDPFLETAARVLLRAAELDPARHLAAAQRIVKRLAALKPKARGEISDPRVLAALAALEDEAIAPS